jgi:hypothetical protein
MLSLIEACPDADLNADGLLLQPTPVKAASAAKPAVAKPTGTKPVTVKLDDEDEEQEVEVTQNRGSAKVQAAGVDDDFMAEADALLNS